ncbi:hypothetical protein KOSB73_460008 [Klebsiella grimontii]|uniref:Uncharacterized protein n=1 Tax=Klebsiella grimontii TaxID=2058152 RepID=A0A285B9U1_9ENTR|nr:hypothetical protein KOSB73_460008 [Klebsiella grimontii]
MNSPLFDESWAGVPATAKNVVQSESGLCLIRLRKQADEVVERVAPLLCQVRHDVEERNSASRRCRQVLGQQWYVHVLASRLRVRHHTPSAAMNYRDCCYALGVRYSLANDNDTQYVELIYVVCCCQFLDVLVRGRRDAVCLELCQKSSSVLSCDVGQCRQRSVDECVVDWPLQLRYRDAPERERRYDKNESKNSNIGSPPIGLEVLRERTEVNSNVAACADKE